MMEVALGLAVIAVVAGAFYAAVRAERKKHSAGQDGGSGDGGSYGSSDGGCDAGAGDAGGGCDGGGGGGD